MAIPPGEAGAALQHSDRIKHVPFAYVAYLMFVCKLSSNSTTLLGSLEQVIICIKDQLPPTDNPDISLSDINAAVCLNIV